MMIGYELLCWKIYLILVMLKARLLLLNVIQLKRSESSIGVFDVFMSDDNSGYKLERIYHLVETKIEIRA